MKNLLLIFLLLLFGCASNSPSNSELVETISKGSGVTPQEALQNAMFNAIRTVTGEMMMGQDTLINYNLVEKRFNYSDGVIVSYKELSSQRNSLGLYTSNIRAVVNKSKLTNFLRPSVSSSEVDGQGMFASGLTSANKIENQKKIINQFINKFYSEGLEFKLLKIDQESKPNYLFIHLDASVSVKPEFVSNFRNVMNLIGVPLVQNPYSTGQNSYNYENPLFTFYGFNGAGGQGTYPVGINLMSKNGTLVKKFCGYYAFQLVDFHQTQKEFRLIPILPPSKDVVSFFNGDRKFRFSFQIDEVTQGSYQGIDHLEKLDQLKLVNNIKMNIDFSCSRN